MRKMKSLFLLSIVSILLVAGCTNVDLGLNNGNSLSSGQGLEMTSFTVEPSTVYSGTKVRLNMEVQNMGGTSVNYTNDLVYLTGTNFDKWQGTAYNSFGTTEMKTQDVVRDVPANVKKFSWSLTAPAVNAGQLETDTFIARVYTEYQTNANANVWVYSEGEADAARTAGRSLYTPTFTYTNGPVGLSVSVSPNPAVIYSGDNSFTMNIKISNQAQGTIYYPGSVNYANSVTIDSTKLNMVKLSTVASDTGVTVGTECNGDQELIEGKDTTVVCTITVPATTFKSYGFSITAKYGYFTEKTATVTVQGK